MAISTMWKVVVKARLERLRREIDQLERHVDENDPSLAHQMTLAAFESLRVIKTAIG